MNLITAQLTPLSPLLSPDPIPKDELVQKARQSNTKRSVVNLLEMIDFGEAYLHGKEIVLK